MHIDAMSYAKFNVLHWHIVDGVAFPYESAALPSMSKEGAYSPKHVYSIADVKALVAYAMSRGVRVIPEFDTPGHVSRGSRIPPGSLCRTVSRCAWPRRLAPISRRAPHCLPRPSLHCCSGQPGAADTPEALPLSWPS